MTKIVGRGLIQTRPACVNGFMYAPNVEVPRQPNPAPPPGYLAAVRIRRRPMNRPSPLGDWLSEMEAIRRDADEAAFARLFAHFAPRVKAFLMRGGTPADVAEDCAQDVMATLWRKAHLFDGSRASVATWIFTIARNRRIDVARRDRRPQPEDLPWGPEEDRSAADELALAQESAELGRALALLPEKQRLLIERAYFGDLSHSEIAGETGLPLGTIKSRIRLALERLRHAMKRLEQ